MDLVKTAGFIREYLKESAISPLAIPSVVAKLPVELSEHGKALRSFMANKNIPSAIAGVVNQGTISPVNRAIAQANLAQGIPLATAKRYQAIGSAARPGTIANHSNLELARGFIG